MKSLADGLAAQEAASLYRHREITNSPQGSYIIVGDTPFLSFCSNDYLGLANHPKIIAALKDGAERYGVGSGAAHLLTGHSTPHHALEQALAAFTGRPRALLFSTGYMANLGVISALAGKGDALFEDRLNHASLIDGAILSRARLLRYQHGDVTTLQKQLNTCKVNRKIVITDGVFSMDGDIAPLPQLATVCHEHDAWLMVDDAHGLGVVGSEGRGCLAHFNLNESQAPILMGTLGKALGTFGAFVAGSEELIETLIQKARTYIFTTAIPPAIAHATCTSLQLVKNETWRREHLSELIARFREGANALGITLHHSETPIQPLIIGDSSQALAISDALKEKGILIPAIRPPTVANGSARLRVTFSANHTLKDINVLLQALDEIQWP